MITLKSNSEELKKKLEDNILIWFEFLDSIQIKDVPSEYKSL